jgi:hypothetical protein
MQANLKHVYVEAPVEVAQQAWQRFAGRGARSAHHASVHFIPAEGGCVVVAEEQPLVRTLLQLARPIASVSERDLGRFKQSLEHDSPLPGDVSVSDR